jgi:uncharacterized SAM-binding protein YcdF (DUF218 family)
MDGLFFWLSKLVWLFISPDSLLLLWLVLSIVLLWAGKDVLAKRLLLGLMAIALLIALFPVGEWLLYPLESRYPVNPELSQVDGIIVLGGAEDPMRTQLWNQITVGEAAERDLVFMALARQHPDASLIFTGGAGSMVNQQYKAADAAMRIFSEQGMDLSRITFESESRNTWESAVLSKNLVQPEKDEKWVLITTGWHMPRSIGIFCKADWRVIPYPVDFWTTPGYLLRVDWDFTNHLRNLVTGVKEWIGIVSYRMVGKSC